MKPRTTTGAFGGIIGVVAMCMVAGVLVAAAVTPVVALSGLAATTGIDIFEKLPDHVNPSQLAEPSTLYAKGPDGTQVELTTFYDQDRKTLRWDEIPQMVKDAAVAEEDPHFYTHGGVNLASSARAALQNLMKTGRSGASTITMQYVRNVLIQEALAIPDKKERKAAYERATAETADRKLKEMRYAISLEKRFTKNEILLGYLNIALFGRKVYGIESAAKFFFSKSVKDLSLAEAASLVATLNAPGDLEIDIPKNIPANKQRRDDRILGSMLREGRITQAQYDEAVATPVEPKINPRRQGCDVAEQNHGVGAFCDYVLRTIKKDPKFGKTRKEREFNFSRGGYKIYTTIDLGLQDAALEATRATVPALMDGINAGSATSSVEVNTGRVLTMAQNRPFSDDPDFIAEHPDHVSINYNTDFEDGGSNGFQVGSTFKPVTLAEWIRTGHSVRDIVNVDGRTVQESSLKASCLPGGVYGGSSFPFSNDNTFTRGNQEVRTAIAKSVNGGLVSMQQKMDLCDTFKLAQKLGIHRASEQPLWTQEDVDEGRVDQEKVGQIRNPTLNQEPDDLTVVPSNVYGGVDEIAPITMASAYAAFAGGGTVCSPMPIDAIKNAQGEDVAFTGSNCREAISPEVAAGVAYTLQYAVTNGLANHAASAYRVPHLAKTGTTDDVVDNWTVGASTKVATATWVGNAGPSCDEAGRCGPVSTQGFWGPSGTPLMEADQKIWPAVMNAADAKFGGEAFPEPSAAAIKQTLVQVPDLRGKTAGEARAMLTKLGFSPVDGGEVDAAVAQGQVARTEPGAGSSVGVGAGVTILLSNGQAKAVPEGLVGETGNSAKSKLKEAGFRSVGFACEASGKANPKRDSVVAVDPAGSELRPDQAITLVLACTAT